MKDKINVAELLRNCPKGMELDCTMFDDVKFSHIQNDEAYPIVVTILDTDKEVLTAYGTWNDKPNAKCVIFPKGKTTWGGFQRPFKDGDIIFTHANCLKVGLGNTWISIFQEKRNGGVATYVDYAEDGSNFYSYNEDKGLLCMDEDIMRQRFATEEEKAELFNAIKANGYKWNPETKTLEKLINPKFKVGDKIVNKNSVCVPILITKISDEFYYSNTESSVGVLSISEQDNYELIPNKSEKLIEPKFKDGDIVSTMNGIWIGIVKKPVNCAYETYITINGESLMYDNPIFCFERFATENEKAKLFKTIKNNGYRWNEETKTLEKLIKPKFKVGDKVRHKDDKTVITITGIKDDYYFIQFYNIKRSDYQNEKVSFKDQDKYKLAINKFNINTLVPFESRVLARDNVKEKWHPGIWGYYDNDTDSTYPYKLIGVITRYCIPYEGNEHLLGTTDDCDEFYKTWES